MKISRYILLASMTICLNSCDKWLDVKPEDKFLQTQVYQNKESVKEIINGFYLKMGENSLYGSNLTLTSQEVLAQRYIIKSEISNYYNLVNYKFDESNVKGILSAYWINMYAIIANINDFINILPTVDNGMTVAEKNSFIAEAIGLRAFLHFDLLRLFGPIYNDENKGTDAIPYVKKLSTSIPKFQNSEQVIQLVLEDLNKSIELLTNNSMDNDNSRGASLNNYFNIHAANALKARVYLWAGDRPNALSSAQEVINAENLFPWVTHQAITSNGTNPDRKFFTEVIFSVFNKNLYEIQKNQFDANLLETSILATGSDNKVADVYENNISDYRLTYLWPHASTGVAYRTFVKYQDVVSEKVVTSRFMIPLIRLSEMYYIAAESTDDESAALNYLNTVRQHRNILGDITDPTLLRNELTKEYMKEFYGEGQLWFYYKRNAMTSIYSVSSSTKTQIISLSDYQFDIPEAETNSR